jgi:hypothetical protein
MRAHTDQEIIEHAGRMQKDPENMEDNRIDITVDMEDKEGVMHTYVVNFCRDAGGSWKAADVSELSSL